MTAAVVLATWVVSIPNVAVVLPAATATKPGSTAALFPLERITTAPLAGAAAERVTVPKDAPVPTTDVGLTVRLLTATVFTWVPIANRLRPDAEYTVPSEPMAGKKNAPKTFHFSAPPDVIAYKMPSPEAK